MTGAAEELALSIARALIRRMNCKPDGVKDNSGMPRDQMQKGYVGNTCAFVQGDGGNLATSLPPSVDDVVSNFIIAFTGSDQDLAKPHLERPLGVSLEAFR